MGNYPRPRNVLCHKVDVNLEVMNGLGKFAKNKDAKLRGIQGNIARCVVPALKIVEGVLSKEMNESQIIETALDAVTLLASANGQLNQVRRDTLKSGLQPHYQSLCHMENGDGTSQWLFGDNLSDRIKSAAQGGKVTRQRGPYGFMQPFARGRRGYQFHPYAQAYTGRGGYAPTRPSRPFLGKSEMQALRHKIKRECNEGPNNATAAVNIIPPEYTNEYACCFRPEGQVPTEPGQQCERQEAVRVTTPADNPEELVGKLNPKICVQKWGPQFEAGRVSLCVDKWAEITSDRYILGGIRGYKLVFHEEPRQDRPMPEIRFTQTEREFVRQEIQCLIQKGVLVTAEHMNGEFISNIFLREKKEKGKYRMILNLKHLNKFTEKVHFKMDTLMTTLALVTPGCTFMSFDFSDAYYSCSIFPPHRKYLRFLFEGNLYEFTSLPNGLSSAPRFFTKIMKIALTHLRKKAGITISGYLDDNILVDYQNSENATGKGSFAAELFQNLGFTINVAKSVMFPTTKIEHLGFIIDSKLMLVSMTEHKTEKILGLIK